MQRNDHVGVHGEDGRERGRLHGPNDRHLRSHRVIVRQAHIPNTNIGMLLWGLHALLCVGCCYCAMDDDDNDFLMCSL